MILITGGAGFIGFHTVELLLAQGNKVRVLDNLSSGKLSNLPDNHPNLELMQADIRDYAVVVEAMQGVSAVLHLAAQVSVPRSIDNPLESLEINTQGFVNVLEAIRRTDSKIHLAYASSAAIYGNVKKLPCSDEFELPIETNSFYALEKANKERYAALYNKLFNISSIGLRYFNVFGPKQDPSSQYSGVISKFMTAAVECQPINIYGDGEQSRDFIYVGDVAQANMLALKSDKHGVCNIATGSATTLNQLVSSIEKITDNKLNCVYFDERPGDIKHSLASVKYAAELLNFSAKTVFEEGLSDYFQSLSS
ncbi:NAD-dependent epimerase/dehydratase family protein [Piscirickettsia litoralis]|uniref:Polysaccharide biosynthesis family protein n=1 Tax=Piscirickettsia litoralis TaxID=1891921 RepID=A0ABX3A3Z6_9GAMM|nr:NAD-dependent epimerase/dehydratase family protein [Piscirickettsia litoralis]ODN42967.1 polysaccharide biosynthesis family protein [Piscirickettsia litoralis]